MLWEGGQREKGKGKTACSSSWSCTGIRMGFRVSSALKMMTERWLCVGRLRFCLCKVWTISLARRHWTHSTTGTAPLPSPSAHHHLRDRIPLLLWGSKSQERSSHLCPQDLTGFVLFVMPEGKAKIPPVARAMKEKSEKDTMQWIFAKHECSTV